VNNRNNQLQNILFILFIITDKGPELPKVTNMPHSNESVLTQKEPVKYTNKKTTDIKLQNYKKYL